MRRPHKNDSADEKVAILRRHLIDRVSVADLCDEHQIQPALFYKWQARFFENGAPALRRKYVNPLDPLKKTIGRLEEKLRRKNEVVAELLEAHLSLKKELGEP